MPAVYVLPELASAQKRLFTELTLKIIPFRQDYFLNFDVFPTWAASPAPMASYYHDPFLSYPGSSAHGLPPPASAAVDAASDAGSDSLGASGDEGSTDEASEGEHGGSKHTEIREQMYQVRKRSQRSLLETD